MRKAEDPAEKEGYVMLTPPKKGIVIGESPGLKANDNADAVVEVALEPDQLVALLYISEATGWYFARTLGPTSAFGYIQASSVKLSEEQVAPDVSENVTVENIPAGTGITTEEKKGIEKEKVKEEEKTDEEKTERKGEKKEKTGKGNLGTGELIKTAAPLNLKTASKTSGRKKRRAGKASAREELAAFKAEAQQLETEVDQTINEQIAQLSITASAEREKIKSESVIKRAQTELVYDLAITAVRNEMATAQKQTEDAHAYEKMRIKGFRLTELERLDLETAGEVKRLEEEGERLAKEAEQHAVDEEKRVRAIEKTQVSELFSYTTEQIDRFIREYDAEGRRGRMEDNLGEMRDDAIEGIKENNDALIEQIHEDAADLAERFREESKEAAESLPENKEEVAQSIRDLADQSIDALVNASAEPLAAYMASGEGVIAQLEMQKQQSLVNLDAMVTNAITEITTDEEKRTAELRQTLVNYKQETAQLVAGVESEVANSPDDVGIQIIHLAEDQLVKSTGEMQEEIVQSVAAKSVMYCEASQEVLYQLDCLRDEAQKGTETIKTEFSTQSVNIQASIIDIYTKAGDQANAGMKDIVNKSIAGLRQTANDSIVEWEADLAEGKTDITEKVDDALAENEELFNDTKDAIRDEAEQLASEWEATYYTRQILSVIGDILLAIGEAILWIIGIVIAIILLVLAIIALIVLLVLLIEALVALVAILVGALVEMIMAAAAWVVEGALFWITTELPLITAAFWTVMGNLGRSMLFRFISFAITSLGVVKILEGTFTSNLTPEQRKTMIAEGSFDVLLGALAEWQKVLQVFKNSKAYLQSMKAWMNTAKVETNVYKGTKSQFNDEFLDYDANMAKTVWNEQRSGLINIENATWAQKSFGNSFSKTGKFSGMTTDEVAAQLVSGEIKVADVSIDVVFRNGETVILNTRSSAALTKANIPRSQWNVVDRTGQEFFEQQLTDQFKRNGLSQGVNSIKQSGTQTVITK